MKSVYIILVNWNGWSDTIECLESLYRMHGEHLTIVVVDNDSTDRSIDHITQWAQGDLDILPPKDDRLKPLVHPPCTKPVAIATGTDQMPAKNLAPADARARRLVLLQNPTNLGFAGGNNRGIRFALDQGADYIWLLNNDTVGDNKALDAMLRRIESVPECGMCGSTLLFYSDPQRVQAYGGGIYVSIFGLSWHVGFLERFRKPPSAARAETLMNYVVGASLCVTRKFVEEIGPMSEEYFLFFEEVDWAYRSRRRYRLCHAPDSIVYHKVGKSIGTSSNPLKKSFLCDHYNVRNRIQFTKKHAVWALPGVYLVLFFSMILRLLLGQWQRANSIFQMMLGRHRHLPNTPCG